MGKSTGFLEYERKTGPVSAPGERIKNFRDFHGTLSEEQQRLQGARCMECGVPFCQAGVMIAGMASGCPLQPGTGNQRPGISRQLGAGLYQTVKNPLLPGIHLQGLPGFV